KGDRPPARAAGPAAPRARGAARKAPGGKARRAPLADGLVRPDTPSSARAAVNRLWFHLTGRGIVDPVDDFRDSNPPTNAPLLDALAADFVAHGYGVKHTPRTILRARAYQLSSRPTPRNAPDRQHFSRAPPRLVPAARPLSPI